MHLTTLALVQLDTQKSRNITKKWLFFQKKKFILYKKKISK